MTYLPGTQSTAGHALMSDVSMKSSGKDFDVIVDMFANLLHSHDWQWRQRLILVTRIVYKRVGVDANEFGLERLTNFTVYLWKMLWSPCRPPRFSASILLLSLSDVWCRSLTAAHRSLGFVDRLEMRSLKRALRRWSVFLLISSSNDKRVSHSLASFLPAAFQSLMYLLGVHRFLK